MASEEVKMILTVIHCPNQTTMMKVMAITRIGVILEASTAGLLHQVYLAGAAGLPDLDTEF